MKKCFEIEASESRLLLRYLHLWFRRTGVIKVERDAIFGYIHRHTTNKFDLEGSSSRSSGTGSPETSDAVSITSNTRSESRVKLNRPFAVSGCAITLSLADAAASPL